METSYQLILLPSNTKGLDVLGGEEFPFVSSAREDIMARHMDGFLTVHLFELAGTALKKDVVVLLEVCGSHCGRGVESCSSTRSSDDKAFRRYMDDLRYVLNMFRSKLRSTDDDFRSWLLSESSLRAEVEKIAPDADGDDLRVKKVKLAQHECVETEDQASLDQAMSKIDVKYKTQLGIINNAYSLAAENIPSG
jgi:hypothetical protein